MARLVYGMMQSLDGYIAGPEGGPGLPMPDDALHQHFNDLVRETAGELYGRRMYQIMRYWDGDMAEAPPVEQDFAEAWRGTPKWVVSRTLKEVGPNATLIGGDLATEVRRLKAEQEGQVNVAGAELAGGLTKLGLIDEYRLYLMPVVLGGGKAFFAPDALAELEFIGSEIVAGSVPLLRYRRSADRT